MQMNRRNFLKGMAGVAGIPIASAAGLLAGPEKSAEVADINWEPTNLDDVEWYGISVASHPDVLAAQDATNEIWSFRVLS